MATLDQIMPGKKRGEFKVTDRQETDPNFWFAPYIQVGADWQGQDNHGSSLSLSRSEDRWAQWVDSKPDVWRYLWIINSNDKVWYVTSCALTEEEVKKEAGTFRYKRLDNTGVYCDE